jgi:hypothetical protein
MESGVGGGGGGGGFSVPLRPAPSPTQLTVQMVSGLSWGKAAGAWCYHPPPSGATLKERWSSTSAALCTCIDMLWDQHHLYWLDRMGFVRAVHLYVSYAS